VRAIGDARVWRYAGSVAAFDMRGRWWIEGAVCYLAIRRVGVAEQLRSGSRAGKDDVFGNGLGAGA
jgi:hypothetical protein